MTPDRPGEPLAFFTSTATLAGGFVYASMGDQCANRSKPSMATDVRYSDLVIGALLLFGATAVCLALRIRVWRLTRAARSA